MLRRAPVRIEAENFGHQGRNVSYSVKNRTQRSKFYRTDEPVMIQTTSEQRRRSEQHVVLSATEWTAYDVDCDQPKSCVVMLKVRGAQSPAEAQLQVNDQPAITVTPGKDWSEIKVGATQLNRGINRLKWTVKRGTVELDWLDVQLADAPRKTVEAKTPNAAR
jgi:hypothetical protein